MRLLTKTILYFLVTMIPLLGVAGYYLFSQFSREIDRRSDQELMNEEIQWIRYLQDETAGGATVYLKTPDIQIQPVNESPTDLPQLFNRSEFNTQLNTSIPFRQLSHVVSIGGISYLIILKKSQEQKLVLVSRLTRMMLFVFLGLLAGTLIFYWIINKRIWKPFRQSLQKIKSVELPNMQALRFEETNIREFNELNTSLNYMTGRIHSDYLNMKEFTENAAHEMQTPIAVVNSKLELLLQDAALNEDQARLIVQASEALQRLGKLNQDLLLLAKIENYQFETQEPITLNDTIAKYLRLFNELILEKKIQVETNYEGDFNVILHPFLADSLISNLLANAIRYNIPDGKIRIQVSAASIRISNTSDSKPLDPDIVFKRFNKPGQARTGSSGLGLAIARKITDTHDLQLRYSFDEGMHRFEIRK